MESVFRKALGIVVAVSVSCHSAGQAVFADENVADTSSAVHHCHHENQACQAQPINLDLSSAAASTVFNGGHQAATVNIDVGGVAQTINPGQMVTPAQAVAAYQVLHGGVQNILLGTDGSAIGGSMVIGSHLANMLNSLVIPTGVTVVDRSSTLNLAGDISNSGTLLAISTNPAVTSATITASSILNGQSGLLTTVLPDGGLASLGLSNYSNLVTNLSLNLNAINNIINSGIISSAGNLNMTAGGSIQNVMASPSALAPIMQAAGTMSMLASQITNAGTIQSLYGNINVLSSLASPNINITGTNGVMEALNGAINLRDAMYTGSGNIDIFGGDWFSREFNFYTGTGTIMAQVGQVTGIKTSYAGAEHFSANTANLILGDHCITGDPTYANTGNITISGALSPSEAIAIIAGGSVLGDATASITTNGTDITIVAGAHITSGGGTGGQTVTNATGGVVSPVTYTFDNTANGNIDFTPSSGTAITSNGGNVTLLANHVAAGTGNIWFKTSTTSINTTNAGGNGGNVLIVAGGQGGNAQSGTISQAIQLGPVQTSGINASGSVTIYTAAPVITGGSATYNTNGQLTSGSYPTNSNAYTFNSSGQINIAGNITTMGNGGNGDFNQGTNGTSGGSITIRAGSDITASNLLSWGGGGGGGGPIGGSGGAGGNGGNISVISDTGTLTVSGEVNSSGGGGGGTYSGGGGAGGSAGTIRLEATNNQVSVSRSILASNGGAGVNGFSLGGGGGGSFGGGGGGGGGFTASGGGGGNGAASGGGGAGTNSSFANGGGGGGGYLGGGVAGDAFIPFGGTGVDGNAGGVTSNFAYNPSSGVFGALGGTGGGGASGGAGSSSLVAGGGQGGAGGGAAGAGLNGNSITLVSNYGTAIEELPNIVGGIVSLTNNAATNGFIINSGTVLSSYGGLSVTAATFNNGSTITNYQSGNLTIAGGSGGGTMAIINSGTINQNSSGSLTLSGGAGSLVFRGSGTYAANGGGITSVLARTAGKSIQIANGAVVNIAGGNPINFSSPSLIFLASSVSPSINATGASTITIDSGDSASNVDLTITGPSGFTGTLTTAGGGISIDPTGTGTLSFAQSSSGGTTLNFNSSASTFTVQGASSVSVASGVTVASNRNIDMTSPAYTINGAITTTATAGTITLQSSTDMSLAGVMTLTTPSAGSVSLLAMGAGKTLTIGDASGIIISGGGAVNIRTPNFAFNSTTANTTINATGSSTITIDSGNSAADVNMTITGPSDFSGTISTVGSVTIDPTGNGSLSFQKSGSGAATLNFNQAFLSPFVVQGASAVSVASGTTVVSNQSIEMTSPSFTINGGITTTKSAGTITLQNTLDMSLSGSGTLTTPSNGTTYLLSMGAARTLTIADATDLQIAGGGAVYIRTPNLTFGSTSTNSSITATGNSAITIDAGTSGPAIDLTITGASGREGTIATGSSGSITISPTGQGNAFFAKSSSGATILNFNGAPVTLTDECNFTFDGGVTFRSDNTITFNLTSTAIDQIITINGTLESSKSDAGNTTILLSCPATSFTLAGTGSILQSGAGPGDTVFSSGTKISLLNGTDIVLNNTNAGGTTYFYTPVIAVSNASAAPASATLSGSNTSIVLGSANGCTTCNLSFELSGAATSGTLNIGGVSLSTSTGTGGPLADINFASGFTLSSNNDMKFTSNLGTITNDGTIQVTGANSLLQFASFTDGDLLKVINNSIIESTGGGGSIIGFNGGANPKIEVSGTGTITGSTLNFGKLNSTTLQIDPPSYTISSFSGLYTSGDISIDQTSVTGSTINISGIDPNPPTPAPSPSPSPSTAGGGTSYFVFLQSLSILQQSLQNSVNRTNEQIGTRLATDYTPPIMYMLELPLQGGVQVDQLAGNGQGLFAAASFTQEQLNALAAQGIVFGSNSGGNFLELNKGDVLFTPTSNIQVQTKEGIVTIPAGAVVLVMETGNDAAVYDLHDRAKAPVKVVANGKEMTLSPGTQILMTRDSKGSFESLNPGAAIGTRNVRSKDLGGGIKVYIAEFSITGGAMSVSVMRDLLKSSDPVHVEAANKMLKNAAILSDLGGYKTPYKTNK